MKRSYQDTPPDIPLPLGEYAAVCIDAQDAVTKTTGEDKLVLTFDCVTDHPNNRLWKHLTFGPKVLRWTNATLAAFGIQGGEFDTSQFLNRQVLIRVTGHREDNGVTYSDFEVYPPRQGQQAPPRAQPPAAQPPHDRPISPTIPMGAPAPLAAPAPGLPQQGFGTGPGIPMDPPAVQEPQAPPLQQQVSLPAVQQPPEQATPLTEVQHDTGGPMQKPPF